MGLGEGHSHMSVIKHIQVLVTEHETKTWRGRMAEAVTSKCCHNSLYTSFSLREPHFDGHIPKLLADVGDPWDTVRANQITMEVWVEFLRKVLKRRANLACSFLLSTWNPGEKSKVDPELWAMRRIRGKGEIQKPGP